MLHFKLPLLLLLLMGSVAFAQEKVSVNFSELVKREDFSSENKDWPFVASYENLFGIDKDEYYLHRMNPNLPYALMAKWKNNLTTFNIMTALKLGPSDNRNQTIGIIFYVQSNGKGAIVYEINKFKEYRVKQLVGKYYRYLTGTKEELGWVKNNTVNSKNEYNELEVKVEEGQMDFYMNGKFLESFDALDYGPGTMGLLIGPNTKAKADFFYLYTTSQALEKGQALQEEKEEEETAKDELRRLKYKMEQIKRELSTCTQELDRADEIHGKRLAQKIEENDHLRVRANALQEFKDQLVVNIDEDVFITLTTELRDEIRKNQILMDEVKQYKDSLWIAHTKYQRLKLALLDKAIAKGKKDKIARDKQEAKQTKKTIEKEVKEDNWKEEQEEWEQKNAKPKTAKKEVSPAKPTATAIKTEADPAVIPVRIAQKKQD